MGRMSALLPLLAALVSGCHKREARAPELGALGDVAKRLESGVDLTGGVTGLSSTPAGEAPPPPEGAELVLRALSAHDGSPDCAAVEALAPDGPAALRYVATWATMPPVAPMRAAACLVDRHATSSAALLVEWVRDPNTAGLGRLVLGRLDALPEAVAISVATAALGGPLDTEAREAAAACSHEGVRGVAP